MSDEREPSQDRLDEVDEHIRAAERQAEETFGEPGQPYVESGNEQAEAADDQEIVPPG